MGTMTDTIPLPHWRFRLGDRVTKPSQTWSKQMTDEAKALVYRMRNLQVLEYPQDRIRCADRIEALEAENERLREALEPFTFRNLGDDEIIFLQYPSIIVRCEVTYGDVQLARAALAKHGLKLERIKHE